MEGGGSGRGAGARSRGGAACGCRSLSSSGQGAWLRTKQRQPHPQHLPCTPAPLGTAPGTCAHGGGLGHRQGGAWEVQLRVGSSACPLEKSLPSLVSRAEREVQVDALPEAPFWIRVEMTDGQLEQKPETQRNTRRKSPWPTLGEGAGQKCPKGTGREEATEGGAGSLHKLTSQKLGGSQVPTQELGILFSANPLQRPFVRRKGEDSQGHAWSLESQESTPSHASRPT